MIMAANFDLAQKVTEHVSQNPKTKKFGILYFQFSSSRKRRPQTCDFFKLCTTTLNMLVNNWPVNFKGVMCPRKEFANKWLNMTASDIKHRDSEHSSLATMTLK